MLVQWKLRDWMVHIILLDKSSRNDWEDLDQNTLKFISLDFARGM